MADDTKPQGDKMQPGSPTDPVPFGAYYLLGLIARGGMAEVYRARAKADPETMLAIKVMRPQLAKEARFVDMFKREGTLALMLRNNAIVRTLDVGRADGRYFMAMEYIAGKDLTQVLRKCQEDGKRIPVPHAVYIAAKIAEGLHHAHTLTGEDGRPLNIVNRDVSPSNVRLSYDGEVKLIDFGIAQALMKFTSEIGILKGKFSYMSPEQIRGMPVDARTDLFSAGIILHEMLTTEKLFRGDTEFALMEKVRKADVPPPSRFNRRVTPELDAVVLKCLARDVGDRYQNGAQMAEDLNKLLVGYNFKTSELQELIRGLFRSDYSKEVADLNAARTSIPESERPSTADITPGMVDPPTGEMRAIVDRETAPPPVQATTSEDLPAQTDTAVTQTQTQPPQGATPSKTGFWSKLFGGKK